MTTISIENLRDDILNVDQQIIELIAKRQEIVIQIGEYKKAHNLPVFDSEREKKLKQIHDELCIINGVSPLVVEEVFNILITESRRVQQ